MYRVAFDYVRKHSFETVRVIRLTRNMGKVQPPLRTTAAVSSFGSRMKGDVYLSVAAFAVYKLRHNRVAAVLLHVAFCDSLHSLWQVHSITSEVHTLGLWAQWILVQQCGSGQV